MKGANRGRRCAAGAWMSVSRGRTFAGTATLPLATEVPATALLTGRFRAAAPTAGPATKPCAPLALFLPAAICCLGEECFATLRFCCARFLFPEATCFRWPLWCALPTDGWRIRCAECTGERRIAGALWAIRGARAIDRPTEWPPPLAKPPPPRRASAAVVASSMTANRAEAPVTAMAVVFTRLTRSQRFARSSIGPDCHPARGIALGKNQGRAQEEYR